MRLRKEWRDVTKWLLTGYRVHSLDYSFFITLVFVFVFLTATVCTHYSFFIILVCLLLSVFPFVFAVAAKTSTIFCLYPSPLHSTQNYTNREYVPWD